MTSFPEQQSNINEKSHAFVLKMEIKMISTKLLY